MNDTLKKIIKVIIFIIITLTLEQDSHEKKFYEDIKLIDNPNTNLVLVNKFNRLDDRYIPSDLEKINLAYANNYKYLRSVAKNSFEIMSSEAKKLGLEIVAVSAFRSYRYQKDLYEYYVKEKGLEYADKASARPGHSEHQTGLTLDVMGENGDYNLFEETKEFRWLKDNAYKYGFILRYPKGKEHITGFKYEPWHYRYVGSDIALEIYENNLTLEEYLHEQ